MCSWVMRNILSLINPTALLVSVFPQVVNPG